MKGGDCSYVFRPNFPICNNAYSSRRFVLSNRQTKITAPVPQLSGYNRIFLWFNSIISGLTACNNGSTFFLLLIVNSFFYNVNRKILCVFCIFSVYFLCIFQHIILYKINKGASINDTNTRNCFDFILLKLIHLVYSPHGIHSRSISNKCHPCLFTFLLRYDIIFWALTNLSVILRKVWWSSMFANIFPYIVHVSAYWRFRLYRWEFVHEHWRRLPNR